MKRFTSIVAAAAACAVLAGSALAESVTVTGAVVNASPVTVSASLGGTVSQVAVSAGDRVQAGDTVAVLEPEKVYALQDGTVRIFGEIGDSAELVASRYGAVVYVEPACAYTVSATTGSAYDLEENRIIHPGETVYLRAVSDSRLTGAGLVTAVTSDGFTVEVTEGSFDSGASVYLYRDAAYTTVSRLGKGTVAHQDPVAYTAEGVIVRYAVEDGTEIRKGDVLFETLAGSYTGQTTDLNRITAGEDGVVAELGLIIGSPVAAGDTVMTLYADDTMRIEAAVPESDLAYFRAGAAVQMEIPALDGGDCTIPGTVEKVSGVGSAAGDSSSEASFTVLIVPESTDRLSYGMSVIITGTAAE